MSHQHQHGWESRPSNRPCQETHTIAEQSAGAAGQSCELVAAPHPKSQVTCAITAPRANLRVLLREHVMTPAVSGYASALALSKATSAMRVDGNIS